MTPQTFIAHYRITAKLGQGGMGAVFRATDTKLGRDVAVKVLPDSFAADPERMARFTREAHVLASLNHPNIAAIYGVEQQALVLELVEGPTLADRIARGPVPPAEAMPLLRQLIEALEYAHERGVVHRDLKPANIKITADGVVKLLDFGLAKALEPAPHTVESVEDVPTMTLAGSMQGRIMGTAAYMSPEQARGAKVDHRSDIWAFGAVLYEMLTGRQAFAGSTISDTLAAVLKSELDLAAVPPPFRRIAERSLQRDLRHRLGWIGEARVLLDQEAEAGSPPGIRRRRFAAAAAIILAAAIGGFWGSRVVPGRQSQTRELASRITRITADPSSRWPILSPDGKMVAYAAKPRDQNWGVWVQHVGTGGSIRIVDGDIAGGFEFSADGSRLYYISAADPPGIYEVPVLGGESRLVVAGGQAIRVSPDGNWFAHSRQSTLYVQPVGGGDARELTRELYRPGYAFPLAWSPDSRRLLAAMRADKGGLPKLAVFALDGAKRDMGSVFFENLQRRGFGDLNVLRLHAWLPDGDIVFSARYGDAGNIWRIALDRAGEGEPLPVTLGAWDNTMADIRGGRLVYANSRFTNQVWRLPADLNAARVLGEPQRVTPELMEVQFPDVRPDSSALTYISRRDGGQGVFFLDLRTGKERSLFMAPRNSAYSTFSPDGRQVAFGQAGPGWPAFAVSIAGGAARPLGNIDGRIRGWSRDGRFLLVWRLPERSRAGVLDVATGSVADILRSDSSIEGVRFSSDSRWLGFESFDAAGKHRLWIAPFRGAEPVPQTDWIEIAEGGTFPFWSPDGRQLYYVRERDNKPGDTVIFRQPLDHWGKPSGPPSEFYSLRGADLNRTFLNTISVSREHVYLLMNSGQSDLWLMDLPSMSR